MIGSFYGSGYDDPDSLSFVRLLVGGIFLVCVTIVFLFVIRLQVSRVLPAILVPFLVSVLMYFCVMAVVSEIDSHLWGLLLGIVTGVLVYTVAMLVLLPVSIRMIPEYRSIQTKIGKIIRTPMFD
ncbi:hypothetical protein CAG72_13440 [Photobacterium halotolerans]|uniref:Uncharacterized protein n=1 Tax=Photobacterium halotolerans TaxID=265726 RepID=A0A7X4WCM6_9GAMM|nr:hypothetical protein [Photobacterium halotolerans]